MSSRPAIAKSTAADDEAAVEAFIRERGVTECAPDPALGIEAPADRPLPPEAIEAAAKIASDRERAAELQAEIDERAAELRGNLKSASADGDALIVAAVEMRRHRGDRSCGRAIRKFLADYRRYVGSAYPEERHRATPPADPLLASLWLIRQSGRTPPQTPRGIYKLLQRVNWELARSGQFPKNTPFSRRTAWPGNQSRQNLRSPAISTGRS